jgi:hypothetical protein
VIDGCLAVSEVFLAKRLEVLEVLLVGFSSLILKSFRKMWHLPQRWSKIQRRLKMLRTPWVKTLVLRRHKTILNIVDRGVMSLFGQFLFLSFWLDKGFFGAS